MSGDRTHSEPAVFASTGLRLAPEGPASQDAGLGVAPCPSIETVLLDDGSLLLLPVRGGGEQLQAAAPWGRMVHEVVVTGRPVADVIPPEDRELFDATIGHLAAAGVLIPSSRMGALELGRYDRQIRWFAQEGLDGASAQQRMAAARVLVCGVGGFGAAMTELLARAGVGSLILVDGERVEEANLPRQLLYQDGDIGARKVFAAAAHVERIAPEVEVHPEHARLESAEDVTELVCRYAPDLVVCAADRPVMTIKEWMDDGAFAIGVPVLHGGSRPPYAFVGPFVVPGVTSCYGCFAVSRTALGAEALEAEVQVRRDADPPDFPSMGWGDVTAAALAAGQAVAWLSGAHAPTILDREWELDLRTLEASWAEPLPERGGVVGRCPRCAQVALRSA